MLHLFDILKDSNAAQQPQPWLISAWVPKAML
jgi:hypothetical protein